MGIHDGSRHQLGSFVASVPEHETLVTGSLLGRCLAGRGLGINSLGNIRTLSSKVIIDENVICVKHIIIVHIANFANSLTDDLLDVELGFRGDFTANTNYITLNEGLASNSARFILSKASVKHGVGNRVGNFVWMAFANRLGGEYEVFTHDPKAYWERL
jgi:hypothetical protein